MAAPITQTAGSPGGAGSFENQQGDLPLARFGHTTTYMGRTSVILFGGAVGDTGRYNITNDTYMLDLASFRWSKVHAESPPSARAAHAATCVDAMQFVVYGGATGGGSLSTDELYLLDLRKQPLSWMTVPITGVTPGRRYGHTMVFHRPSSGDSNGSTAKANLIVFGGNDGHRTLNDIWFMDVQKSPFSWNCVELPAASKQPPPRVYHSAEICRDGPALGMMVVFGGRTAEQRSLKDAWGLRQHRDGRWDWVDAPIKRGSPPEPRFQHTCLFLGSKMIVIGGRDTDVTKPLATALYDTETCEWRPLPSMGRFRHSSWSLDSLVYTFGGFDHRTQSHPTADLQSLDVTAQPGFYSEKERRRGSPLPSSGSSVTPGPSPPTLLDVSDRDGSTTSPPPQHHQANDVGGRSGALNSRSSVVSPMRPGSGAGGVSLSSSPRAGEKVRISMHVHTIVDSPNNPDFSALVRKISIDKLEDEGRKIRGHALYAPPLQPVVEADDSLTDRVIRRLLRPNITIPQMEREFHKDSQFSLAWEDVSQLCTQVLALVRNEEMVLRLRAPIKVYGDIHGQYYDLMRLFGSYKSPVEEDWHEENDVADAEIRGDIDSIDYLFLGDFVDRGTNSLEVICLLFALKCKYPRQVHLIRGNHEDPAINSMYGFKEECHRRLREDSDYPESCWARFNRVFEHLPVGAVIEDRILCIHGGIGGSITDVQCIAELHRPLVVSQSPSNDLEQRVTDLLWSDPTDDDSIRGVIRNETRDPDGSGHIVKFGPDRVASFLQENKLDLIIRAHECVMDGFERFAGGKLITLFSATDYCGHHKNAGALLFIRRDLTVIPKIIYPAEKNTGGGIPMMRSWIADPRHGTPPRQRPIRDSQELLGF